MKASYFPKALLYKEWRGQRLWLGFAAALILVPSLWSLLNKETGSFGPGMHRTELWTWLVKLLYGQNANWPMSTQISGHPVTSMWYGFVAVGLAVAIVGYERRQGVLYYTLTSPVRKADLLRVKFFCGLAVLASAMIGLLVIAGLGDSVLSGILPVDVLGEWFLVNVMTSAGLYAIAFLVAQAVGTTVGAGLIACGVSVVPAVVGSVLRYVPQIFGVATTPNPMLDKIGHFLVRMSPGFFMSSHSRSESYGIVGSGAPPTAVTLNQDMHFTWPLALAYVLAIGLCYLLAQWLFARAYVEKMSNVFIFPVLWQWAAVAVSAGIGLFATRVSFLAGIDKRAFLLRFVIFTALIWLFSNLVRGTYRRFTRREV